MYIAFKWLIVLALMMWMSLCCIDLLHRKTTEICSSDLFVNPTSDSINENMTISELYIIESTTQDKPKSAYTVHNVALLHYLMFFAGGLAVMVFNRKTEIITYTKSKIFKINKAVLLKYLHLRANTNLKETAIGVRVTIQKKIKCFWEKLKRIAARYQNRLKQDQDRHMLNLLLLKKIREIGEERNNMAQLLVAAVQANKNIRMQYQLESMAKNRLVRHIEDSQKQIKENRSKYVNFQQLYVITHQENIFLKARIKKLTSDKEAADKSLLSLVTKIYDSTDSELKACCSRFLVRTKDSLQNCDVSEEIQKLLMRPKLPTASASNRQLNCESNISLSFTKSWPSTRVTQIMPQEENLVLIKTNAPKLRGLPGEYIWTVKDKNGIIEKLYEYDCGYDFGDNVETIRRIRQYSVYHDKDCLLDFSNSRTILPDPNNDTMGITNECPAHSQSVEFPTRHRFLTDSEAFQTFLKNNNNFVASKPPAPPILCG